MYFALSILKSYFKKQIVMKFILKIALFLFFIYCIFSCQRENYIVDSSAKLSFSTDTLLFDTIFTTIGSTTQYFTVRNPHSKPIEISTIKLARENSYFRLNINGQATSQLHDVTIAAKDSLYIFVEVTVNPQNESNPVLIQDSVVFETNGNRQDVDLVAYGQDVQIFRNQVIPLTTLTADKPYLMYDTLVIPENQTVTIDAGAKLYFTRKSMLIVLGQLVVNGTVDEPVLFAGSRLEEIYEDVPGEWQGIIFATGSTGNQITNAEIRNAVIGLNVGTLDEGERPTLTLHNTKIMHHSYAAIFAVAANITASNCLMANCQSYASAMVVGGSYEYYHCTFANYWGLSVRTEPMIVLNNQIEYDDVSYSGSLQKADFVNCIVYGAQSNEIGFGDFESAGEFNYLFNNCLLKIDAEDEVLNDETHFVNNLINPEFNFIAPYDHHYALDTLSVAKDAADISLNHEFATPSLLQFDLEGTDRTIDAAPDLGALERVENEEEDL